MQLPWYVAAIGAAVAWGLHYPLIDFALKRVSLASVLVLTAVPILLLAPFYHRTLAADFQAWRTLPGNEQLTILALMLSSLAGTLLLFLSIAGKNATLAALLEITYPVFVVLFAWLLFREWHVSASVALGALLVFAGVGLIIWNNP
jgi:drug/metabolite transporter (DMT)-like permease